MIQSPDVSIVIVCMNRLDNLYPCLESIKEHCRASYETLVVAYRFSDENFERLQLDFPWVNFIRSTELRGFSENNNLALSEAKGRYCFILNDDTIMTSDVISQLSGDFDKLPDNAAIVTPKLLNADGSLQLCGRPPYPALNYVLQQWHLYKEPIDDTRGKTPIFDSVYKTSNISGAAFLIKTDVFRSLGWFDESYFFTPEDIALSTLARKRNYGVYVDSSATIVHKWRTTASRISPAVRPASVRGSLIFFSSGSSFKYFLIALPVWLAESLKWAKASIVHRRHPSAENRIKMQTYRNISHSIFTRVSPKELFKRYV